MSLSSRSMKAKQLEKVLKKALVIDVREGEEYKKSKDKIKGAKNIPMGKVFLMSSLKKLSKRKKIIVVCLYGSRSGIVARELKKKGYNIERLDGGIKGWVENNNS